MRLPSKSILVDDVAVLKSIGRPYGIHRLIVLPAHHTISSPCNKFSDPSDTSEQRFRYLVPVILLAAHFPLGHGHDHNPDSNPNLSTSVLPCEGGETTDSSFWSNTSYNNQLHMYFRTPYPSSPKFYYYQ